MGASYLGAILKGAPHNAAFVVWGPPQMTSSSLITNREKQACPSIKKGVGQAEHWKLRGLIHEAKRKQGFFETLKL
jgi:hypothetical protein